MLVHKFFDDQARELSEPIYLNTDLSNDSESVDVSLGEDNYQEDLLNKGDGGSELANYEAVD